MTATERKRLQRKRARAVVEAEQAIQKAQDAETLHEVPGNDAIDRLVSWSASVLLVPPGHPKEGEPMELPEYVVSFLKDAITHRESLLCLGRKNAKGAIVAVYLLGRMVGPLHFPGWRGGVVSVNKEKAGELKTQMEQIAEASGSRGLQFYRSPTPGRVVAPGATLDVLSADKSSGHASGFDDALVDETGLLQERDRQLVNGLRSSISARNGRIIHLSIHGDGPFVPELLELRDDPAISIHHYAAPEDCDLQDEAAWRAANPGDCQRY